MFAQRSQNSAFGSLPNSEFYLSAGLSAPAAEYNRDAAPVSPDAAIPESTFLPADPRSNRTLQNKAAHTASPADAPTHNRAGNKCSESEPGRPPSLQKSRRFRLSISRTAFSGVSIQYSCKSGKISKSRISSTQSRSGIRPSGQK